MGILGNFLCYIKDVKDKFEAQERRWIFSGDDSEEMGLISL